MTAVEQLAAQPTIVRRSLALALLALAMTTVVAVIAVLISVATSQSEWRTAVRAELAELKGRAATTEAVRESLSQLTAASVWNGFYTVAGGGDGSSLIHSDVAAACAQVGATVLSVTPLPSRAEHELAKYGVRLSATMTARQLQSLIATLRDHRPYLRTEELTISAPQMQAPDADPTLTVTFEVVGYARENQA